jgi:serine/threonine protein kinase
MFTAYNNSFGSQFYPHPQSSLSYRCPLHSVQFLSCLSPFQPERINPELNQKGYSVKSDIWSLGITMVVI